MKATRLTVSFSPLSLVVSIDWPISVGAVVQQSGPSLSIALSKLSPFCLVPLMFSLRGRLRMAVGLVVGIGAALPFDAARIGGRLIDLVRGTSAEAALPVAGHHESATGDVLHQLLVSLALAGGALPVLVHALARSYVLVPAGSTLAGDGPLAVARLVGVALATGLAVAAPVVALSWATDAAVGIVLRAAPGLPANELATPVRILGGGTVLWLSLGLVSERMLRWVLSPGGWLLEVLGP